MFRYVGLGKRLAGLVAGRRRCLLVRVGRRVWRNVEAIDASLSTHSGSAPCFVKNQTANVRSFGVNEGSKRAPFQEQGGSRGCVFTACPLGDSYRDILAWDLLTAV